MRQSYADLRPTLAGMGSAIAWLRDHNLAVRRLAGLFATSENHIRQLAFRGTHGGAKDAVAPWILAPRSISTDTAEGRTFRQQLRIRPHEDSVVLSRAELNRLEALEEEVQRLSVGLWGGFRFAANVPEVQAVLVRIGYPAHYRRLHILAKVHSILGQSFLQIGCCASALAHGLRAWHLFRIAHHESGEPADLHWFGRTALLVSQTFLLRREPASAGRYLECYRDIVEALRISPRPDYFHQSGKMAFQLGDDETSKKCYGMAVEGLARAAERGEPYKEYQVFDAGVRHCNLLGRVNWDRSLELFDYMLRNLSPDDVHVGIYVNWTAACGYMTDSPTIQQRATEILRLHRKESEGFGHQATVTQLLSLTPDLPAKLRAEWSRFVLYENAFRNR